VRFLVWSGVEEWLTEVAAVELVADGLRATGTQIAADPAPFRIDYRIEALDGLITRELDLTASGQGWSRGLALRHDGSGGWQADLKEAEGHPPGEPWEGGLPDLSEALDIDIENSPLTNTMPILRGGFMHEGSGDLTMAFIRTPSLRVEASPQRYEHLRASGDGAVVRYLSRDSDFTADLTLDPDGLVLDYPRLARRVEPGEWAAPTD
jgi:hypothetical protein